MARRRKKSRAKKYYVLRKGNRDTEHVFSGSAPRQAALKAATRGFTDIRLRERGRRLKDGRYPIHVFKGSVKSVRAPENRPDWLPDKVKKPTVRKIKMEYVKKL